MSIERNGKTYETVDKMFSKIDNYWKNLHLFWKIAFKIRGYFNFNKKDFYWFFQRIFKGYSDADMWNFDHFMAKKIHKYLVKFRQSRRHGYCGNFNSMAEWNVAIDKMIWSMKQTAKGFPGEDKAFRNNTYEEYYNKIHEGNVLFGEHFNGLWD
jgi:hypothetical protein